MAGLKMGELVRGYGIGTGALYEGRIVRLANAEFETRITVDRNISKERGSDVGVDRGAFANIVNVKKVESMAYVSNLIGPKPEPVQEPKFVAPFKSDGRNVLDANRKVVTRIQFGGYQTSSYRSELPMAEAYELARLVAEALTAKYAVTVADSKSPF